MPRIEPRGPTDATVVVVRDSDIFSLFLSDHMLAKIVLRSNDLLAHLRSNYHHKGNVALRDMDLRELKAFIGILIMSSVRSDNHTTMSDMWDLPEGNRLYRCTMSERHFTLLMRVLRFNHSATRVERVRTDHLAPNQKLFNHVVANCQKKYSPGPHLTVEEQLIPFRGRCPFRMYIQSKQASCSVALFSLH
ncbi:uncharacterized protein LOC135221138 [Macrobrachium nipponense]|uniref:uncharacterized protein LOC135221138 n=1 Tax=Macrobrachium nipponense TaxID=159736 RepID=UPI0030C89CA9